MRLALPLLSAASAPLLGVFFSALKARFAPPAPSAAPVRSAAYALTLRVEVALRAAARARR